jgi:2-polyprenyl-3-methyl-5-hydroxy-6-metoxy-1,4-benzoquinol methylase
MGKEISFEEIYAQAGTDLNEIPWATLRPMPELVSWLDRQPPAAGQAPAAGQPPAAGQAAAGQTALVVACGLGDDAEEVSRRGFGVTAFDLVPAAIAHCWARFPDSAVDYEVADVFRLPSEWSRAFDLVVEVRTLQSLPVAERGAAAASIAGAVAPGGRVFVHGLARRDDEPAGRRPWPLSPRDLTEFTRAGLTETELNFHRSGPDRRRTVDAVYTRRAG